MSALDYTTRRPRIAVRLLKPEHLRGYDRLGWFKALICEHCGKEIQRGYHGLFHTETGRRVCNDVDQSGPTFLAEPTSWFYDG